ncbi:MAG: hemolysin III family protein [Negativicutes bacterium]|nr:hemolysin III family protein [Negativicutes bacterium]
MTQNTIEPNRRELTIGEEIANSITHGIGALLSIAGLVILIVVAANKGTAWHVVSFAIFGATMVFLYASSTLYHSLTNKKAKSVLMRLDHAAIFALIAGTYTPFLLTTIRGPIGWTFFGIIWAAAIAGIVVRTIYLHRFRKLMVVIYLIMGWMFVFMLKPMLANLSSTSLLFLLIGGISYTVGVIFYAWRSLPYGHGIWHLFVLGGTIGHFFAVLFSIA